MSVRRHWIKSPTTTDVGSSVGEFAGSNRFAKACLRGLGRINVVIKPYFTANHLQIHQFVASVYGVVQQGFEASVPALVGFRAECG